jgi:DNA-binding transcriptional MocR family regulator
LDRADGAELPLTQDFMAQMLAVRRTTVTLIAGKLQYAGLIRYRRGLIQVLIGPDWKKPLASATEPSGGEQTQFSTLATWIDPTHFASSA